MTNDETPNDETRRGFLPFETNLFDRVFIAAVLYIGAHLLWMRFIEQFLTIEVAHVAMLVVAVVVVRRG